MAGVIDAFPKSGKPPAADATNVHYDLPPELFECFLGARMKYTCGLYASPQTTLDEAQEAKLAFIAERLGIRGGEHVLDIGVGWGALAFYLAERHRCRVVGITPSRRQADYTAERALTRGLQDLVAPRQCSIYDLQREGCFDAVAMVGVIEHLPDHHRALAIAAGTLKRDGRLYMSASCYRSRTIRQHYADRQASRHVTQDVFGYGALRPLSELVEAAEQVGLSLSGVTDLTQHYQRTVEDWRRRVVDHRERIDGILPGAAQDLIRFLETTNAGWGMTTKHYAITAVRSRWGLTEALP